MPTRLLALAVALLAVCVAAGPASAASPARCAKGKIRLVKTAPCVKVQRGAPKVPAALRGDARFRKVAGPRAAKRAEALVKSLTTAALRKPARAARARAHAADVVDLPDGDWHDVDAGGVPGRMRTTEVVQEGATPTQVVTREVESSQKVDGATVALSVTRKTTISYERCPDANGVAHGMWEALLVEHKEVVRGKERAFVERRTTRRGKITAQVGDDAKIARATYDGTVDLEIRGTAATTRRYLATWTGSLPLPAGSESDYVDRFKRDPAEALTGNYRGPKGARLTEAELALIAVTRATEQFWLEDELGDILIQMEQSWGSEGACLDLLLDPPSAALAPGQVQTFSATAQAKDGTPIGGPATAGASGAEITPDSGTMEAGTPLKIQLTMGDKDKAYFFVEVKTKRGVASKTIEIPRLSGWDVTFTATGSYAMQIDHHGDTDTGKADFSWTTTFHGIRLDGGQYDPFGQTAIAGTMSQNGTLGTGTYTCTGAPSVMQTYNSTITPAPASGGGQRIRIVPFTAVLAERTSEQCAREGYGGTYGHVDGITSTAPYEAHVTVTPEQLASGDFTVAVHRDADFTAGCEAGAICSYNGDMTGTVHFVRR
jgi:hypothetical protein